jgi:hypothetical protein
MADDEELDWGALEPIAAPPPQPIEAAPPQPEPEILPPAPTGPIAPDLNPLALKEDEAIFARVYVETGNKAKATEAAGLKGGSSMGRKILDRPHVAAEVARLSMAEGKRLVPGASAWSQATTSRSPSPSTRC